MNKELFEKMSTLPANITVPMKNEDVLNLTIQKEIVKSQVNILNYALSQNIIIKKEPKEALEKHNAFLFHLSLQEKLNHNDAMNNFFNQVIENNNELLQVLNDGNYKEEVYVAYKLFSLKNKNSVFTKEQLEIIKTGLTLTEKENVLNEETFLMPISIDLTQEDVIERFCGFLFYIQENNLKSNPEKSLENKEGKLGKTSHLKVIKTPNQNIKQSKAKTKRNSNLKFVK